MEISRIDLRPATTRSVVAEAGPADTEAEADGAFLPPLDQPVEQTGRRSSRRQSLIWDLLNPRLMRDASPQERIAALRRLREERRASQAEEAEARRIRRLTARLHDVFHIRTTRNRQLGLDGETSPHTGSVEAIPGSQAEHESPNEAIPQSGSGNIETIHESQDEHENSSAAVPAPNRSTETIPEQASPSPVPESSSAAADRSPNKSS
jgi:hypothetical protein